MEKKSNHQVKVVRIEQLLPHTNADSLELIHIGGYQVVVKKGQFSVGDLAVYVQPDSVVPQTEPFKFIWEQYQTDPDGFVPEKRRRITVRKFRKEWSEGLLLPLTDFPELVTRGVTRFGEDTFTPKVAEGDDVSDLLGITHYEPEEVEGTGGANESGPKGRWPRSAKGWFYFALNSFLRLFGIERWGVVGGTNASGPQLNLPVYDVDAYKNYVGSFKQDEPVVVTEKIHGSNARFVFSKGKMYAGSRQLWKAPKSNCIWRKVLEQQPWIELWCRNHEGYALYGEVVPTQVAGGVTFNYGTAAGETNFFVFDIRKPDGTWTDWVDLDRSQLNWVPVVYAGLFDEEAIKKLVEGPSTVAGAKHIREGVVVKPQYERHVIGLGRLILKLVSNKYLELN